MPHHATRWRAQVARQGPIRKPAARGARSTRPLPRDRSVPCLPCVGTGTVHTNRPPEWNVVIPWRARSPQVRTRPLIDVDEAVAAPADGGKPGARADNRRRAGRGRDRLAPTVEPQRRRAGVQPAFSLAVLPAIPKHINDRVAHCPRGGECPGVIAIPPHAAGPVEGTIYRLGEPDGEALNSA